MASALLGVALGGVVPAPFAYSLPAGFAAAPAPLFARAAFAAPAVAPAVVAPAPVIAKVKALDYADAYPQYQYAYNVQVSTRAAVTGLEGDQGSLKAAI